jgi:hypothetical protein
MWVCAAIPADAARLHQSGEENEHTPGKGEGWLVLGDFLPPSGLHPLSCDGL